MKKLTPKEIIYGIKGITKSILGIDVTDNKLAQARIIICSTCSSLDHNKMRCNECGCKLKYKVLLNNEKCPLGKW